MDYKKIFKDTLSILISHLIVSCFFGIPFLILYVFDVIFKYFDFSKMYSFQFGIVTFVILLIFSYIILFAKGITSESKKYIDKEKADIVKWRDENLNTIRSLQYQVNVEKTNVLKLKNESDRIIEDRSQSYPWAAKLYSDHLYVYDEKMANALRSKRHPAEKAAQQVLTIAKEKRDLQKLCKMLEYQINYYESIFPWLEEFKEIEPITAWEIIKQTNSNDTNEYNRVKNWLSPDDYNNLPSEEKWQLALDRYCKKRKTNWEVGIDFERYVGYKYEIEGYKVKYQGALLGLEDMGRDVIASKKNEMLVIQCKRWAKNKTIHEKHIFQLYGSIVVLRTQNPTKVIDGVFITTTKLSEVAKECAEYLGIKILEEYPFEKYPMIKCNKTDQSNMIYHLPFDQQYDRVHISMKDGDLYVDTVKEAEMLGFRHTFKWHGTTQS